MTPSIPRNLLPAVVPEKVFDVIDSCRSAEQLFLARRYVQLWLGRQPRFHRSFLGYALSVYLLDKCNLLILESK